MKTSIKVGILLVFLLISFNLSAQEYQWAHSFGSTDWEEGLWVDHDSQGNIYIIGYFYGTIDFDPGQNSANLTSAGQTDIFIASYDPNGNLRWAINPGGPGYDIGLGIAVFNDRVFACGYFLYTADFDPSANTYNITSNGEADAFLACYSTDGDFQWANGIGSTEWDSANRVKCDLNGNPIATGNFIGTVDFDPSGSSANLTEFGASDAWIAKYNADGTYNWAINPGGSMFGTGNGITIDYNDNVYVTGRIDGTIDADPSANTANLTSNGGWDILLLSYDNNGNYRWSHSLGGTMNDIGWSITHQANDAGDFIYLTGSFEGTADFDPSANDNTLNSYGDTDIFVGCFDSNGNHMGAYNYGGPNGDAGYSIDADQTEDLLWVTGAYGGDGNLKNSTEIFSFPTQRKNQNFHTNEIAYILALFGVDKDGNPLKQSYNPLNNDPPPISALFPSEFGIGNGVTAHNPVYLIGEYTGSIDLDASDNDAIFTSNGDADFFIAKYSQNSLAVDESYNVPESFSLEQNFPNPFNPTTTIEYNVPYASHVTIDIIDINGKLINTIVNNFRRIGNYSIYWDGRDSANKLVSSGTYFYRLRSNGEELSKKMILIR